MKLLIPTAGSEAAQETAAYIMQVAQRLDADVIALHVDRQNESGAEAIGGPLVVTEAGRIAGIATLPVTKTGDLVEQIIETANEFAVDLIIMGASHGAVLAEWLSVDVKDRCQVPVLVVPHVLNSKLGGHRDA